MCNSLSTPGHTMSKETDFLEGQFACDFLKIFFSCQIKIIKQKILYFIIKVSFGWHIFSLDLKKNHKSRRSFISWYDVLSCSITSSFEFFFYATSQRTHTTSRTQSIYTHTHTQVDNFFTEYSERLSKRWRLARERVFLIGPWRNRSKRVYTLTLTYLELLANNERALLLLYTMSKYVNRIMEKGPQRNDWCFPS